MIIILIYPTLFSDNGSTNDNYSHLGVHGGKTRRVALVAGITPPTSGVKIKDYTDLENFFRIMLSNYGNLGNFFPISLRVGGSEADDTIT